MVNFGGFLGPRHVSPPDTCRRQTRVRGQERYIWRFLKFENSGREQIPTKNNHKTAHRMGFCSFCNHEGHNKRNCSAAKLSFCLMPEAPTLPTPPKRGYHCRTCGEGGHNSQNCPQGSPQTTPPPTTGRHCRVCGESGHNIRTCHVVKTLLNMNTMPTMFDEEPNAQSHEHDQGSLHSG